jgi:hypothetical protein
VTADRKHVSTRDRLRIFEKHGGVCHLCRGKIDGSREAWDVSHDIPLEIGGADDDHYRKPAHRKCHRAHTAAVDAPLIAKTKRQHARAIGAKAASRNTIPGSRGTKWKRKLNGETVLREMETTG